MKALSCPQIHHQHALVLEHLCLTAAIAGASIHLCHLEKAVQYVQTYISLHIGSPYLESAELGSAHECLITG